MNTTARAIERLIADASMDEIHAFLPCPTPSAWVAHALENTGPLLVDHANCEKKAAATAMNLLYRYSGDSRLPETMSRLAREELLHFEQVVGLLRQRGIAYGRLSASRYAGGLRDGMRGNGPGQLVDTLLIGALVEARSCERFAKLAPLLDESLGRFYAQLLRSESRHYQDYLGLARSHAGSAREVEERLALFRSRERELIESPDPEFRFHSGVPTAAWAPLADSGTAGHRH